MELRHHFLGEQLKPFADMLVRVLPRLIEHDDLIDMARLELPQFLADRVRRADQSATQSLLDDIRVGRFQSWNSFHRSTVPARGR